MKWISFVALMPLFAQAIPVRDGETFRVQIPGEYIVQQSGKLDKSLNVLKKISRNLYLIKTTNEKSVGQKVEKIYPNYEYYGNYLEGEVIDDQVHHQMVKTKQAWQMTRGESDIVVAVTDNEFELDHDDLKESWWTNAGEIPDNGIDDDGNGYVDDVTGWDFVGQDNNVDAGGSTHGTHVSGIIAAQAGNQLGVAGIAPQTKIMPLRWYGRERRWTSALVAETYRYAVDNGAKIISTSYNIDSLASDQAYLDAVTYATDNQVMIFNSAGNSNRKNPARQSVEDIVLVCSVTSKALKDADKKSRFSNYGTGIDICAPGDPIYSAVQGRTSTGESRYGNLSGTSMAAPVAAAVAALIWSADPSLTVEEVKDRLYRSADNIDAKNRRYKGMLGAGRVNAFKALQ